MPELLARLGSISRTGYVTLLIITRLLQGAGAALLTPGSLAILQASFRPADPARAIGAWSGLGGSLPPPGRCSERLI
jgi:hypothetical protein